MSRRLWAYGLVAASTIFLISTYLLIDKQMSRELWGHLPLYQFSAGWFVFIMLVKRKTFSTTSGLRNYGLATLSALLLTLGFPPFPLPFLLLIAFVPMLYALHLKRTASQDNRSVFLLLLHTFILWNIWATFWVANTAYAAGIFANLVNALLMTIPLIIFLGIVRHLGKSVALVSFTAAWIAFEFLHMRWELYWPWLTLGNGLATMPVGIQWYEITGTLGGSLWLLVGNYLGFQRCLNQRWKSLRNWWLPAVWVIVPMLISAIVYASYSDDGDKIEVVAVQPNLEPHYEKFNFSAERITQRFLTLSRTGVTDSTDYLIFPETSLSNVNLDQPFQTTSMVRIRQFLQEYPNMRLVSGLEAYRILEDPIDLARPTTRPVRTSRGDTAYLEAYNCSVQMDAAGNVQESYKAKYVPGAEYFPFKKILFFLKPIVDRLGGTSYGYRIPSKHDLFSHGAQKIAPSICYESIFGEFTGRSVLAGGQAIFIMTNDGWWDNTAGHRQHVAYARLRAIECRRSIARSANMGTCCFINQRGDITSATDYGVPGTVRGEISLNEDITFYTLWGDVVGRICLFITILLMLRAMVKRIQGGQTKQRANPS